MNPFVKLPGSRHSRRATAIAVACGFLLVLPSCGIPNLRRPDPAPPLPEGFKVEKAKSDPKSESDLPAVFPEDSEDVNSSEDSGCLRFEEFFDDPSLVGLIHQALAGNQEQKILQQDVQVAFNQILARQAAYLPFVTVGGRAGGAKASNYTPEGAGLRDDPFTGGGFQGSNPRVPPQFLSNPHGDFQLGANLFWQLDIWRQLRNARDAAIKRYLATNEGRNYAVTRLVAEIADNYYQLLALDARLQLLDQIIAIQEQSQKIAEARFEAARGNTLAIQRFQAEVRKNQSEKLIVAQDIIEAENRINFLVGRFPQPVERSAGDFVALTLHKLGTGVPSQLLQNRPDIRRAELDLQAAGLDVKVARTLFYPRLIINGNIGYAAFDARYLLITPVIQNIFRIIFAPEVPVLPCSF